MHDIYAALCDMQIFRLPRYLIILRRCDSWYFLYLFNLPTRGTNGQYTKGFTFGNKYRSRQLKLRNVLAEIIKNSKRRFRFDSISKLFKLIRLTFRNVSRTFCVGNDRRRLAKFYFRKMKGNIGLRKAVIKPSSICEY